MPGVNLSQSIAEKSAYQAKSGGDKGRLIFFGLFGLTLLVWGGVRAGMFWYDKKITTIQQQIEEKKASFSSSVVSDIADVDARLGLINTEKTSQVYPKTVLVALESAFLPSNYLTSFTYNFKDDIIKLSGKAPGYKEVSQQLMALKSSPRFSGITLENLSRERVDDASVPEILFDVNMVWNSEGK